MLVLSFKEGERAMIGTNIIVTVLERNGDKVRIGFSAPREVPVMRESVLDRLAREQSQKGGGTNRSGQ